MQKNANEKLDEVLILKEPNAHLILQMMLLIVTFLIVAIAAASKLPFKPLFLGT